MKKFLKTLFILGMLTLFLKTQLAHAQTMNDYCITPPFVVAGVEPNLLLMIDNSASMYDLAYISSTTKYCYDDSYNDSNDYAGYFSKIDESGAINYPIYSYSVERFVEVASIPGICTYGGSDSSTPFLCINITDTGGTRTVTEFTASGRFLNWLSASKFDVEKQALTGGKYDSGDTVLIGESRGCLGRRFVKEVNKPDGTSLGISFAIRGPFAFDVDFVNPDTQGGHTRIEIYENDFQEDYCLAAAEAWETGSLGQWQTNAQNCVDPDNTIKGDAQTVYIDVLRNCYQIKKNINDGLTDPDPANPNGLWKSISFTDLKTHCDKYYLPSVCPDIDTCTLLNDEDSALYICASTVSHIPPPSPYYDSLGSDTTGFIGRCWKDNANSWPPINNCVAEEILHFCSGFSSAEVIDPSEGAGDTQTTGNIPAILVDLGVGGLGDPVPPAGSTDDFFYSKASSANPPTGLIQKFEDLIRFGAMAFNFNGSDEECSVSGSNISCPKVCSVTTSKSCVVDADCPAGETCLTLSNADGGQIINYIKNVCSVSSTTCKIDQDCLSGEQCISLVGDHASGLIKSVDNIPAMSWTPFAEAFHDAIGYFAQRTDLRISAGNFITESEDSNYPDPVQYRCQNNNVLIISDGMSTGDLDIKVRDTVRLYHEQPDDTFYDVPLALTSFPACPEFAGSRNLDDLAWIAKNRDIRDFNALPPADEINSRTIITHVVFTGKATSDPNECDPHKLMQETAENGGTDIRTAEDPGLLYKTLEESFQRIAARASSGTAASVLASGEGSGANLLQALFFPQRTTGGTTVKWTGSLQNFWYYIDPFIGYSSIRENTSDPGSIKELNLSSDYIMHFKFPASATDQNTIAELHSDSGCDGDADSYIGFKYLDEFIDPSNKIKYLWEAGKLLWAKNPLTRNIYTYDGTTRIQIQKVTNPISISDAALLSLLQAADGNEANAIMRYVRGEDTPFNPPIALGYDPDYRRRTITLSGVSNTWKLGDIVTSTPKVASWAPLNAYHKVYGDSSYGPYGYSPKLTDPVNNNHFISTQAYKNRGMVFVGANDGMLHAFKLGTVKLYEERCKKAELQGAEIGEEMWSYIPRHTLPYLQYMTGTDYCHLYFVDAAPNLFDVSIGGNPDNPVSVNSWRTVLIGGMRYGGACRDTASTFGVQTPSAGRGYSSYFALDITNTLADPAQPPEVLWEFSNEEIEAQNPGETVTGGLGFATSGPAIVRIGPKGKNGKWFVVFASGPTGPIQTDAHQFMGYSDQQLKVFILDLATGNIQRIIRQTKDGSTIQNAFAGSLTGSPIDLDQNNSGSSGFYSDDAIYFGYTQAEGDIATSKWTNGGVLRLDTKESADPTQWALGKVIDNIGPVTSAVSKLQNYEIGKEALWLFFGSGRYYYKIASEIDDANSIRKLYGLKEPCFDSGNAKLDSSCNTTFSGDGSLGDVTTNSTNATSDGWKISLDSCTTSSGSLAASCADSSVVYRTERLVTDPLATPIGAVFFTTIKPSADVCEYGGVTHLWAVQYATGGAVKKGVSRGKALIQVSTGSIEEKDLSTAFTQKKDEGAVEGETVEYRRTGPTEGIAATEKPQINIPPRPVKRVLHLQQR
jgi:type IV pilus assembly protein PilY1